MGQTLGIARGAGFLQLKHPALPPVALIGGMYAVFVAWNGVVGLRWAMPNIAWLVVALLCSVGVSVYAGLRGSPRLAEFSLVIPFYLLFPVLGVQLSYLCFTLHFPLVDTLMSRLDLAVEFSWHDWARFNEAHPWFSSASLFVYESHFWQMLGSILLFGLCRPRSRNYEMLFILVAALIATLVLCALLPTLGPAILDGQSRGNDQIAVQLRDGRHGPFDYVGMVAFPSYHTVLAITFVYCHRDIGATWLPVLLLNLAMLVAIPYNGNHYVMDMLAGGLIALVCILLSRQIYGVSDRRGGTTPA